MKNTLFILAVIFSASSVAGVYKCTDAAGNTSYQTKPCEQQKQAFEINIKTGSKVDLNQQQNQQELAEKQRRHQELEKQLLKQKEQQQQKAAIAESVMTQTLIKNNPLQYSAFAIPPFSPDKIPVLAKQFGNRLPEIEKFRRLAAQKALTTDQCQRVEASQLNIQSQKGKLVFLVDCSSGKSFYFKESELIEQ